VRVVVVNADVALPFKDDVPRVVVPSRNVTVPVATLLPACGDTLAVKVTLCPVVTCVAEAESVVVVAMDTMLCETTTLTACDTELLSLLSPA
jgi:hypothetical protein